MQPNLLYYMCGVLDSAKHININLVNSLQICLCNIFMGEYCKKDSRHQTRVSPQVLYLNSHVAAIFYSCSVHILFIFYLQLLRHQEDEMLDQCLSEL